MKSSIFCINGKNKKFVWVHRYANSSTKWQREKEAQRLGYLYEVKKQIKDELLDFQNTYSIMDDLFSREIKRWKSENVALLFLPCFFPEKNFPHPRLFETT